MKVRPISRLFGLLALGCCALTACNRSSEPDPASVVAPKQVAKSSASASSVDPLAGLVKAVASDTRPQIIELRFEFAGRPQVGQAVEIKLNLRAVDDSADVKLTISSDPQIAVITGGEASFASLKAGEMASHSVTLRGAGTGIFVVNAKLTTTANGGPHTLNYAIPVAIVPVLPASSSSAAAATTTEHK